VLWLVMFFAGFLLFRVLAPARAAETDQAETVVENRPAVEKQP